MTKPSVASAQILKLEEGELRNTVDLLAVEEPMEVRLGYGLMDNRSQKSISVTMRTPGNDFELATGFLFTEGIIQHPGQVYKVRYCTELNSIENKENIVRVELHENVTIDFGKLQRNFYTTSSCGVCGKESIEAVKISCNHIFEDAHLLVAPRLLLSLPQKLREKQNVFEYTGGLHACALFDESGELLLLREDVGRHNALDKLIGAFFMNAGSSSIPLNKHILLLSGRASFELLQKASMAGISMVCAVGAPSSLAVNAAKEFNITLVGFLRDQRFNVYSGNERINGIMW